MFAGASSHPVQSGKFSSSILSCKAHYSLTLMTTCHWEFVLIYTLLFAACLETGTSRLVYTSTYNVVFGGQEIRNGDSSLPYLRLDQHVDHYSRTKCIAEQEVRGANGRQTRGGVDLRTCALRCAGIYGEGEQRHLPRIVVRTREMERLRYYF